MTEILLKVVLNTMNLNQNHQEKLPVGKEKKPAELN